MKKILLIVAIFIGVATISKAQNKLQFSAGPEIGITTGDFSLSHSFGIGVNITGEYMFQQSISGTIASGVIIYSGKKLNNGLKYQSETIIPVRAGVRYYLGSNFYAAGEVGLGVFSGLYDHTGLGYSVGLGTKFKTGSKALDVGVKYDAYSFSGATLGSIVFKVAFVL